MTIKTWQGFFTEISDEPKIVSQQDEKIAEYKRENLPDLCKELEKQYLLKIQRNDGNLRSELKELVFGKIQDHLLVSIR